MSVATESVHPAVAARPWSALGEAMFEQHGYWSDYAAWQRWLDQEVDSSMPDVGPIRDSLEYDQDIALYVVMCKLADLGHDKAAGLED